MQLQNTVDSLNELASSAAMERVVFKSVGNTLLTIRNPSAFSGSDLLIGGRIGYPNYLPAPWTLDNRVPHSKGHVAPVGVADLIIVAQQLKAYEGTDIAHIENILKGEKKDRENTTTTTTSTTTTTVTDVTSTSSQDLESTSRFEMSKETSATIKQDSSLKAGVQISASYGPFVTLSASVEGATSRTQEEATKTASKFAQDVTQKASKSIAERKTDTVTVTTTV